MLKIGGQWIAAHRAAYVAGTGKLIPPGHTVDHRCHNEAKARGECAGGVTCLHRMCINPDHLEAVSNRENILRAKAAITHCARGHSYGDPANLKDQTGSKTPQRACRSCNRIDTRCSRGYTEEQAERMEVEFLAGKNRKPGNPA